MKQRFFSIILAAVCLIAASSCSKDVTKTVVGQYHFKLSGNIACECTTKGHEGETLNLLVNNEAGQMRVLNYDSKNYIVTMSVMLSSYTLTFIATVDKANRLITLDSQYNILKLVEAGSASSLAQSAPAVQVLMGGVGNILDGTILFDMTPTGTFEIEAKNSEGNSELREYKITDEDVICLANKED